MFSVYDKLGFVLQLLPVGNSFWRSMHSSQGTFGKCFLVADESESDDQLFALKRSKVSMRFQSKKESNLGRESEVHTHLQKLDRDGG